MVQAESTRSNNIQASLAFLCSCHDALYAPSGAGQGRHGLYEKRDNL
ncbi:hypothetical protein DESPIG_00489 [Desulfovibrio piger ATCC 29098]|uniref:Uncharacterized protein n=1 Tax=Desulfovibrio piger ATCC 29098 TaxID=411464 RepID=B6WR08_9BACT|nr:hypothetical protein DESPIG_00489 [Desulfovibrio piger ATCC 29098]